MKRFFTVLTIVFALAAFAAAQTLQGTAINGTNGKPAAGAEVTLLSLANGMSETGHTKTDASGKFSFDLAGDTGMPHLVRVTHQDVNYFKMAPPGTNSVQLQVYDAAKKLDGLATTVQIMRMQADSGALQVMELYAVQNKSNPARTLAGDRTYEIALPDGAVFDQASARAPNGQPLTTSPSEIPGKKNHYAFNFPLRPGETQFELAYHMPYSGSTTIKPVLLHDVQHFVAMMPNSMQFSPTTGTSFAPMDGGAGTTVQVSTNAKAGTPVAFSVSGSGTLPDESAEESQGGPQQGGVMGGGTTAGGRPGGGLGNPIDSPDPLSKYRWPLIGFFAAVLAIGGVYTAKHRTPETALTGGSVYSGGTTNAAPPPATSVSASGTPTASIQSQSRPNLLLEAMKEELFQLEIERQQGRITEEEYAKSKAALDQTIKRALARASS